MLGRGSDGKSIDRLPTTTGRASYDWSCRFRAMNLVRSVRLLASNQYLGPGGIRLCCGSRGPPLIVSDTATLGMERSSDLLAIAFI